MKKFILFMLTLSILAGCGGEPAQPTQTQQQTQVENVTFQISAISPTGATLIITDTNPEPYLYGEWYKIQRLTDGQWQDLPHIIDNAGFTMIGYLPDENGQVKFSINWEWLYGVLPSGTYRIFKEVGSQQISVEFAI